MGLNSEVGLSGGGHVAGKGCWRETVDNGNTVVTRTDGRTLQPAREDDGRERECGSFFLDPYTY